MKHCHRYIHKSYREACLYDMNFLSQLSKAFYEILVQDEKEVKRLYNYTVIMY